MVSLGDVLTPARDEVPVDPALVYQMMGVRSFGRGPFAADALPGSATRYPRLRRVTSNMVVYPKLMAWEGAFAVVPPSLDGHFVSPEFLTFRIAESSYPPYLQHFLTWPGFVEGSLPGSTGTNARRRRLSQDDFLAQSIPLPDLPEQKRIAAYLDAVASTSRTVPASTLNPVEGSVDAFTRSFARRKPLGLVATVNPKPARLTPDTVISFVPLPALNAFSGEIDAAEVMAKSKLTSTYRQFRRGDIAFARITPSMQNGKSAVFDGSTEFAYGSTEFHVIRPHDSAHAEWIHGILRTPWFRAAAMERFTGTAGQQRVPAAFLESAEIPWPDDMPSALAVLRDLEERRRAYENFVARRTELTAALLAAARNEVFTALM